MTRILPADITADLVKAAPHMPLTDADARLLLTAILATEDHEWLAAETLAVPGV